MNWTNNRYNECSLTVPVITHKGDERYSFIIMPRPPYCDRGDWLIHGAGADMDAQDGFPRYFFGTIEEAKEQVERFVRRRAAYQKTLNQT